MNSEMAYYLITQRNHIFIVFVPLDQRSDDGTRLNTVLKCRKDPGNKVPTSFEGYMRVLTSV